MIEGDKTMLEYDVFHCTGLAWDLHLKLNEKAAEGWGVLDVHTLPAHTLDGRTSYEWIVVMERGKMADTYTSEI